MRVNFPASFKSDDALLHALQRECFDFFLGAQNPENGLVMDNSRADSSCSVSATGFALACYAIGVERGFISREDALSRVLAALRFFCDSEQSEAVNATGFRGFYFHFLKMKSGRRAMKCELSTLDSALFFAGMFCAAAYFDRDTPQEREVRQRAEKLFARANWRWALGEKHENESPLLLHGWRPQRGFLRYGYSGYDESLVMQLLALGAREYSLPAKSYAAYTRSYNWKKIYGIEYLHAGPLFIHSMSHAFVDFRNLRDDWMREKNCDYHENSRRAICVQREYSRRNTRGFAGYNEHFWGLSAGVGPGPKHRAKSRSAKGRKCFDYRARAAVHGPDDGTIMPTDVLAMLPFAPEEVLKTVRFFMKLARENNSEVLLPSAMNASIGNELWMCERRFGIALGPAFLMIENFRSSLPWQLMKRCEQLQRGLERADFREK